jgi:hypothetical protein
VQGPWNTRWLERWDHYTNTFDQIVLSCYKSDMAQIVAHDCLIHNHDVTIILNDQAFPSGVDWYGNIWHQCKTTLAGLKQVRTTHVVKTRTDEFWSNMHVVRDRVTTDARLLSINIYMKKWNVFPLHMGDHLFGGHTQTLQAGFQTLHQLINVDYFGNRNRAAEQKIAASMLISQGIQPNWQDCRQQLRDHWQVIDARLLEPFWFNAPSVNTCGSTLDQVAECERNNHTVHLFDHIDKYLEP